MTMGGAIWLASGLAQPQKELYIQQGARSIALQQLPSLLPAAQHSRTRNDICKHSFAGSPKALSQQALMVLAALSPRHQCPTPKPTQHHSEHCRL